MTSVERDPTDVAVQEDLRDLFHVEMVYAHGPVSRVYVARDVEYNQPVALKVMPRGPQAGAHAAPGPGARARARDGTGI